MTLPSRTAPDFVQELELRTILGVLRRQYKVMLYTAFILMTSAGLYLTLTTPKYTANALIIVDPSAKNILDSTVTGAPAGNTESAKVDSEVEILRSDAIALAVRTNAPIYVADDVMEQACIQPGEEMSLTDGEALPELEDVSEEDLGAFKDFMEGLDLDNPISGSDKGIDLDSPMTS